MTPKHRVLHRALQALALCGWVLGALGFSDLLPTAWLPTAARSVWWILVVVHPIEMLLFRPALRRLGRLDAANLLAIFVFGGIHMLGIRWAEQGATGRPA